MTISAIPAFTELNHSLNADAFCPTVIAIEQTRKQQIREGKTSMMDGWYDRVLNGCKQYSKKQQGLGAMQHTFNPAELPGAQVEGDPWSSGDADFNGGFDSSATGDDFLQDPWAKRK